MSKKAKFQEETNNSNKFYKNLLEENTDEHKIVGQSERSHTIRFSTAMKLGDFSNMKILDLGCGIGGFYQWLKDKNINVDYYGIDISPDFIEHCKEKYPEISSHFKVFDIISNDMAEKFDYIVAIGVLGLNFGDNINMEMTERLITQVHNHSTIGYFISMGSMLTRKPSRYLLL